MIRIYACSSNPGKLAEFEIAAGPLGLTEVMLHPLPGLKQIPPPEETGKTFEEIAASKAIYYSQFTADMVLADDSGLEVEALDGAPGIRSARYAGVGATDQANNELLLANMRDKENRSARFVCALSLALGGETVKILEATVAGELLTAPRGTVGFGYDPLFWYPPFQKSFGEIDQVLKFSVSHRGQALRSLVSWVKACSVNRP